MTLPRHIHTHTHAFIYAYEYNIIFSIRFLLDTERPLFNILRCRYRASLRTFSRSLSLFLSLVLLLLLIGTLRWRPHFVSPKTVFNVIYIIFIRFSLHTDFSYMHMHNIHKFICHDMRRGSSALLCSAAVDGKIASSRCRSTYYLLRTLHLWKSLHFSPIIDDISGENISVGGRDDALLTWAYTWMLSADTLLDALEQFESEIKLGIRNCVKRSIDS